MNLDTLGRRHAERAHEAVADAQVPPVEQIIAGPGSGRLVAAVAWTAVAATALVVAVLLVGPAADLTPTTLTSASENTTTTPPTTTPPATTVPAEQTPGSEVVITPGSFGPEPRFDTSNLGIEQPLTSDSSHEALAGRFVFDDHDLLAREAILFGGPGTDQSVWVVTGVINNPMQAGFGEIGRCVWVTQGDTDAHGECHWILPGTVVRPIAIGLIGVNWVGWGFLPDEASVAVLTVDGVDLFWQRPRGGIAFFAHTPATDTQVEVRVLDETGLEIARGDRTRPDEPTEPTVEPILGYGDYTGVAYNNIDWFEVTALTAQCMNDQGFTVSLIPPGDGINFATIPADQSRAAEFAWAACRAGLNVPEPPPTTPELPE
jgi:hypothetical protein